MTWITELGSLVTRRELSKLYGGSLYGGIESSARTPNVLIFMDPVQAQKNGYIFDGWTNEGSLLYTGEGREGDQVLARGNKAIAEHQILDRSLRVFEVHGVKTGSTEKIQKYIGEFRIDEVQPYTVQEAPDKNGELRTVLVFKLWPIDSKPPDAGQRSLSGPPLHSTTVEKVNPEVNSTPEFPTSGTQPSTAERREAKLVERFEKWINPTADQLKRLKIRPEGEVRSQLTDIYDTASRTLFEAKGTTTRESIRMAIGQLLDYQRHILGDVDQIAILLPSKPSTDLCHLISSLGIFLVYEEPGGSFTWINPA